MANNPYPGRLRLQMAHRQCKDAWSHTHSALSLDAARYTIVAQWRSYRRYPDEPLLDIATGSGVPHTAAGGDSTYKPGIGEVNNATIAGSLDPPSLDWKIMVGTRSFHRHRIRHQAPLPPCRFEKCAGTSSTACDSCVEVTIPIHPVPHARVAGAHRSAQK